MSSTTAIEETAATIELTRFDAESATAQAVDFLKRLGYRGNWLPLKVGLEGENYVVEMTRHNKTAKVQIDAKTKDIKEYELQDSESQSKSPKTKALLFLIAIVGIGVLASKLLGVF